MAVLTRVRKNGKKAYYVVVKVDGVRQSPEPAGHEIRHARSLNRQRIQEIRDGVYQPRTTQDPTVEAYAKDWFGKRKGRARDEEERHLRIGVHTREWLRTMRMSAVRGGHAHRLVEEVEALRKENGEPFSPKYVALIVGTVAQMFATAERHELITRNPFRSLERGRIQRQSKRRRKPYASDAIRMLLECPRLHPSDFVFAHLLFYLGGREGEMCGLTFADWIRDVGPLGAMRISKQYDGQPLKTDDDQAGEHERMVPVHPRLEAVLLAWWQSGFLLVHGRLPRPDDAIVPAHRSMLGEDRGVPMSRNAAYHRWRDMLDKAGVTNLSLHSTRHTWVTMACRFSPKDKVELLSHNPKGAAIDLYNHALWEDLCAIVSRIELYPTGRTLGQTSGAQPLLLPEHTPGKEPDADSVSSDIDSIHADSEQGATDAEFSEETAQETAECVARASLGAIVDDARAIGIVPPRRLDLEGAGDDAAPRLLSAGGRS